jgi:hypothetical protein
MGRNKSVINWDLVEEYLQAHCDGASIARLIGIHYNTFYNNVKERYNCNFSEFAQQKKAEGVSLMEHSIFKDALSKGGADRMFWLKNKAGWRDKTEVDNSIKGDITIIRKVIDGRNKD